MSRIEEDMGFHVLFFSYSRIHPCLMFVIFIY